VIEDPGRSEALDRPRISLCCITGGPLHQVAAILKLYRPVVDEIVVAVNGRFTEGELEPLVGLADRVLPCEMRKDFLQERYRAWLYGQCRGEFICTVDTDEVPSTALLAALPGLAAARDVVTYLTTCRWCYPDLAHWLDEYPWEPSWKMILVRNDPATLHIKGGVHEGVMAVAPYSFLELPVYHISDVTMSLPEREAKIAFYDGLDGNQLLEDGRSVSEVFYLPERFARHPPADIAPEDLVLIDRVVSADTARDRVLERESANDEPGELLPGTFAYETILNSWPERPLPNGAYQARIELRRGRTPEREMTELQPSELRPMMVLIENCGDSTWLREARNRVSLSSRFFTIGTAGSRGELVRECARFPFPADLHPGQERLLPFEVQAPEEPGEYLLVVDLVEEYVRWFESGLEIPVRVSSVRPARRGLAGASSIIDNSSRKEIVPDIDAEPLGGLVPVDAQPRTPGSVRIQSVLYCPPGESLARYLRATGQMIRTTTSARPELLIDVALGDNSPSATYRRDEVDRLRSSFEETGLHGLTYEHFDDNLGHGGAHNRLIGDAHGAELILILNPDTCPSPNLLLELLKAMTGSVGIVEGRQLPLEHQKTYDPVTGDTGWASGACSLVRREVFETTGGYDADAFFLYCDDVDLSWRARLAGYRVVYQPSAVCFHDKRLSVEAREQPSDIEIYHSGLAALLLATKYSRADLAQAQLRDLANSPIPIHAEIVEAFTRRQREGNLPTPLDCDEKVADFSTYAYASLRFDYDR